MCVRECVTQLHNSQRTHSRPTSLPSLCLSLSLSLPFLLLLLSLSLSLCPLFQSIMLAHSQQEVCVLDNGQLKQLCQILKRLSGLVRTNYHANTSTKQQWSQREAKGTLATASGIQAGKWLTINANFGLFPRHGALCVVCFRWEKVSGCSRWLEQRVNFSARRCAASLSWCAFRPSHASTTHTCTDTRMHRHEHAQTHTHKLCLPVCFIFVLLAHTPLSWNSRATARPSSQSKTMCLCLWLLRQSLPANGHSRTSKYLHPVRVSKEECSKQRA